MNLNFTKLFLITFISIFLFSSCTKIDTNNKVPELINGQLNLSNWNFKKNGPVNLKGIWKFVWNKNDIDFIQPNFNDSSWINTKVPEFWSKINNKNHGYSWYRANIKVSTKQELGIFLETANSAYELYVNGKLLLKNGVAGKSINSTIAQRLPVLNILPKSNEYTIAWKISNFHHPRGGAWVSPIIGEFSSIKQSKWKKETQNSIVLGILLMMGLYHIILWLARKKDKASMFFSCICITVFFHLIANQYFLEKLYPYTSLFELHNKLEYLTMPAGWIFFSHFFYRLYPRDFSRKILNFFTWTGVVFLVFTILTPCRIYGNYIIFYQVVLILVSVWCIYSIIVSLLKRRNDAWILLVGIVVVIIAFTNDFLYTIHIIHTTYITPLGLVFFIFSQSAILSLRFARTYKKSEHLSNHLKEEIYNKTLELANRTKQAEQAKNEAIMAKLEIEKANIKLKQMDRYKTHFFQNITHEFRTPLTLILGPLESILSGELKNIPNSYVEQLNIMLKNARRLLRLINQLLDLSKLDSGKMELLPEKIDIVEMLQYITSSFETISKSKKLSFKLITSNNKIIIEADPEKIEKILYNLYSNAYKFTPSQGLISVSVTELENSIKIAIKDTGKGIPNSELKNIFERFRQVDGSIKREQEGSGIGLALVKEYIELHDGNIKAKSKLNEGTVFIVELPIHNAKYSKEYSYEEKSASYNTGIKYKKSKINKHITTEVIKVTTENNKFDTGELEIAAVKSSKSSDSFIKIIGSQIKTILIVEDNADMSKYILNNINPYYNCLLAENGAEALDKIKSNQIDLIISDVMMPKMDGYELLKAIRTNEKTKLIPFIILTAKVSEEARIESLQIGANDYLTKPFNAKELIARINNLLIIKEQSVKINTAYNILKKTKDRLVRTEKLASIGILSAGISHEINNPNNFISLSTSLGMENVTELKEKIKQSSTDLLIDKQQIDFFENIFNKISEGSKRINMVVDSLKAFSHLHEKKNNPVNLNNSIIYVVKKLGFMIENRIIVEESLSSVPKFDCDPSAIEQVFFHIIKNAIQAIPEKGTIELKSNYIKNKIIYTILDSGTGVSKDIENKIFDPFFTTKDTGYGLGLSISHNIIDAYNGSITIYNNKTKGVTAEISLPVNKE